MKEIDYAYHSYEEIGKIFINDQYSWKNSCPVYNIIRFIKCTFITCDITDITDKNPDVIFDACTFINCKISSTKKIRDKIYMNIPNCVLIKCDSHLVENVNEDLSKKWLNSTLIIG